MPGKKNFDAQLAALDQLRHQPDEACVAPLRALLKHQNNYIVSKAADLAAQRHFEDLLPDLLTAFDRFFEDAEKRDPQCWAKNSISRALASLEYQEPAPFLRGVRHIQLGRHVGRPLRHRRQLAGNLRARAGAMPLSPGNPTPPLLYRPSRRPREISPQRCRTRHRAAGITGSLAAPASARAAGRRRRPRDSVRLLRRCHAYRGQFRPAVAESLSYRRR